MPSTEAIASRPRTLKELCAAYRLSPKTMRRHLRVAGIAPRMRQGRGYYYTIRELQTLVEAIGDPAAAQF